MTKHKKSFSELLQPSFEIDFWLKHFRGLDDFSARAYESWVSNPRSNSMFFADTTEYIEEDHIDVINNYPPSFPVVKPEQIPESYEPDYMENPSYQEDDSDEEDEEDNKIKLKDNKSSK